MFHVDPANKHGIRVLKENKRKFIEVNRLLGIYNENRVVVGYAMVSSHTQKDDLDRQVKLIRRYAFEYGWLYSCFEGYRL